MQQITNEVTAAKDEIQTRKQRETERHERKMEEISEDEEEMKADLKDKFGITELVARLEGVNQTAQEQARISSSLAKLVKEQFTDNLSGSYDDKVTVKENSIRKYRKKRNASLSAYDIARGRYRDTMEKAISHHPESSAILTALDKLKDNKSLLQTSEFVVVREVDCENEYHTHMRVKVTTSSYNGKRAYKHYVQFGGEDFSLINRTASKPPYESWDIIENFARNTEELEDAIDELERKWDQTLHETKQVQKRIEDILGIEEETPDVEAHIGEEPPVRADDDETVVYVECMGNGKLGTQNILGQDDDGWVTAENDRKVMFQSIYDALEEATDGRKMRSAGKQFYVLRLDSDENVTDVWTYERYLKSAVDAESLAEAVKNAA